MSLLPGIYVIKSKSAEGAYIGRHTAEDKSLMPKMVLLLPGDFSPVPEVFQLLYWILIVAKTAFFLVGSHHAC